MKLYILLKFGCFYEGNGSYKVYFLNSLNKLDLDFYLLYVKYYIVLVVCFNEILVDCLILYIRVEYVKCKF